MTKDTFVNLNLLYEKIDKLFDKLHTKVFWAKDWLDEERLSLDWIPSDAKERIENSVSESQAALDVIEEIEEILLDFKRQAHRKPAKVISGKPRIGHMQCIRGGQYKPSQRNETETEPILTKEFGAFIKGRKEVTTRRRV